MPKNETTKNLLTPAQPDLYEKSYEEQLASRKAESVECLGQTFPSDDARRKHYLGLLEEKLKDPAFRKKPGFPIGNDEDILRLSDPPYYTACPNPFLEKYSTHGVMPYDSQDDAYLCSPYTADIREGRGHPVYNAHSYHTKVPHQAIMRFILHYTKPGDLVLDGFCGTGMTGVAAQACGFPDIKFRTLVEKEAIKDNLPMPEWGERKAILCDLAPAATFIAANYNKNADLIEIEASTSDKISETRKNFGWIYETIHEDGRKGAINYTIWSEVFTCPECAQDIVFWDVAIDIENGKIRDNFRCPNCESLLTKKSLERNFVTIFDPNINKTITESKYIPCHINYKIPGIRGSFEKSPTEFDFKLLEKINSQVIRNWLPTNEIFDGDKTSDPFNVGIKHVHQYYTKRSQIILSEFRSIGLKNWLPFSALTPRATRMHRIAASRLGGPKKGEGGATVGILSGTLYVPSLSVEMNVLDQATDRITAVKKGLIGKGTAIIGTNSCAEISCPDNTIDYIFTDPPFGENFQYSELNYLWESWLKVFSNQEEEAVISRTQKKALTKYQSIMELCFREYFRVLKPNRWITIEFSNTKASVWKAIQAALEMSGFVVAAVSALDKKQGSFNAVTTATAVKQDLIISAYKPDTLLEEQFRLQGGTSDGAWKFLNAHLKLLPVYASTPLEESEVISERLDHRLFDRMVAFHLQHNVSVPMSVAEFYGGLASRYAERDGMYFLTDQVVEYDKKRAKAEGIRHFEMFPDNEANTIQWLRQELGQRPRTYAEIQPDFMKMSVGWAKNEKPIELSMVLDENFLRYDGDGDVPNQVHAYLSSNFKDMRNKEKIDPELRRKGKDRWYVPDPNKLQDLESKREKQLLKEFNEYLASKDKRIKQPRHEVIRAGFKRSWGNRDYESIQAIAAKIPEAVIQEDQQLLMWYDMAMTRLGDDVF